MTEQEFTSYLKTAIPNYAEEKMTGEGHSQDDALKMAQDSYNSLLPNGLNSENQFLFSAIDSETEKIVGNLWFAKKVNGAKAYAFIYDINLDSNVRGQGFGKQLMALCEAEVRNLGLSSIGLHVFGHNEIATRLYERSGFRTTNRIMAKDF